MSEQQPPRVRHNEFRPPRAHHLVSVASMCALLLGAAACGSDSKQATATSATPAPAVEETEAPTTTAATTTTTLVVTTTTEQATTTTAAARTATGKGTFVGIPEALLPGPPAADGWVTVTGAAALDGDLVGQETYTAAFSPTDAAGVITERADVTFTGTLVGVGDGSFSWHEADHPANDHNSGTESLVGVSGVFEGATGTLRWTHIDDEHGTYEFDFVWA